MDLTPLVPEGRQIIESYGAGRFRVSGAEFQGSIIVFTDRTMPWSVASAAELTLENLATVAEAGRAGTVELLVLGCGRRMTPVPEPLGRALKDAGVVIAAMDTGAACRTYNVLLAEGRRAAAALIALG